MPGWASGCVGLPFSSPFFFSLFLSCSSLLFFSLALLSRSSLPCSSLLCSSHSCSSHSPSSCNCPSLSGLASTLPLTMLRLHCPSAPHPDDMPCPFPVRLLTSPPFRCGQPCGERRAARAAPRAAWQRAVLRGDLRVALGGVRAPRSAVCARLSAHAPPQRRQEGDRVPRVRPLAEQPQRRARGGGRELRDQQGSGVDVRVRAEGTVLVRCVLCLCFPLCGTRRVVSVCGAKRAVWYMAQGHAVCSARPRRLCFDSPRWHHPWCFLFSSHSSLLSSSLSSLFSFSLPLFSFSSSPPLPLLFRCRCRCCCLVPSRCHRQCCSRSVARHNATLSFPTPHRPLPTTACCSGTRPRARRPCAAPHRCPQLVELLFGASVERKVHDGLILPF